MVAKWGIKKTIRKEEYQFMLGKEEERKASDSSKRICFTVRDQPVKRVKLERFKLEHPNAQAQNSREYCHQSLSNVLILTSEPT